MKISIHYSDYRAMLIALHEIISQGTGDSDIADNLRDKMDNAWAKLTPQEIKQVRLLSSDLHGINPKATDIVAGNNFRQILEASKFHPHQEDDWNRLHIALNGCEGLFSTSIVYYYKSRIWNGLGDPVAGLSFIRRSIALDPKNMNIRYLYLSQLWDIYPNEAVQEANKFAQLKDSNAMILFKSADILFTRAEEIPDTPKSIYERILGIYTNAFRNILEFHEKNIPKSVPYGAMVFMGLCWKQIGNEVEAEKSYTKAIEEALKVKCDPSMAFIARGILNYGTKTGEAVDDFNKAIETRSALVWPYFFMAHWSLRNLKFDLCIKNCDLAFEWPSSKDVEAELIQWRAISEFHIDGNEDKLRIGLKTAHRLAPHNIAIDQNLKWFEKLQQTKAPASWQVVDESDVSEFADLNWKPTMFKQEVDVAFA